MFYNYPHHPNGDAQTLFYSIFPGKFRIIQKIIRWISSCRNSKELFLDFIFPSSSFIADSLIICSFPIFGDNFWFLKYITLLNNYYAMHQRLASIYNSIDLILYSTICRIPAIGDYI